MNKRLEVFLNKIEYVTINSSYTTDPKWIQYILKEIKYFRKKIKENSGINE
jgi:vesicle coat complex subunit